MSKANAEITRLTSAGFTAFIEDAVVNGENWHRVRIGRYATEKEASVAAKQLEGADPVELGYLMAAEKRIDVQRERNRLLKERTGNDLKKIALLERSLELKEKQIEKIKERNAKAAEKIEEIRKAVTPEQRRAVQEIYGLVAGN